MALGMYVVNKIIVQEKMYIDCQNYACDYIDWSKIWTSNMNKKWKMGVNVYALQHLLFGGEMRNYYWDVTFIYNHQNYRNV